MADLEKMTKKQLETYARDELGIELDRRHTKKQLLSTVLDHLEDQSEESEPEETPPVKSEVSGNGLTAVRQHIKDLSTQRRDAAIIHEIIKDDSPDDYGTDDEIRKLVSSKNFTTLLGEIS